MDLNGLEMVTGDRDVQGRFVVHGEASQLTQMLIKSHKLEGHYYYGQQATGPQRMKQSASLPARLAAIGLDNDEEDEMEEFDEVNIDPTANNVMTPSMSTDPILKSLIQLKRKLRKRSSFSVYNDPSYITPFCDIVTNKNTSGSITGASLDSLLKFITYGFVHATEALGSAQLIGRSVTRAKFVGFSDMNLDQVVFTKILTLMQHMIVGNFTSLSNETIREIMQGSFRIAFEPALSEILRKNAEGLLMQMIRSLFLRVGSFSDITPEQVTQLGKPPSSPSPVPPVAAGTAIPTVASTAATASSPPSASSSDPPDPHVPQIEVTDSKGNEPHGIECIHELLTFLTTSVNPLDASNQESTITVCLNLLIVAFETSVVQIGQKESLMKVIGDDLTFHLIQLMSPGRPFDSFSLSLRLSFLIMSSLRHRLKYQFESFLVRLKDIVTTQNAKFDHRVLALETLVSMFKHITYLPHELYFNYDLDPYASNLMDDLNQFFSKNCFSTSSSDSPSSPLPPAYPSWTSSPGFTTIQLLSMDALLANVDSLHRAEQYKDSAITFVVSPSHGVNKVTEFTDRDMGIPEPRRFKDDKLVTRFEFGNRMSLPRSLLEISHLKQRKTLLDMASKEFNKKPKDGVAILKKQNLCADAKDVAKFLRDNQNLSKNMMGEFLAKKDHEPVLIAFLATFNMKGQRLDEALRSFLETFRLPGEAPLVAQLLEPFAVHWFNQNDHPFEDSDAAYTLSYAIIMLNVDQHNANVKKQSPVMTEQQFINNVRGVNGGKDFNRDMLSHMFHAIKLKEIVMPAEHNGPLRDKYLWKCLLKRSQTEAGTYLFAIPSFIPLERDTERDSKNYMTINPTIVLEKIMPLSLLNSPIFATLWGPTVSAMTFMFEKITTNSSYNLSRRILSHGFNSCALLCSSYGHLDNLIVILTKFVKSSPGSGGHHSALNGSNTSINSMSPSSGSCPTVPSFKVQLAAQTLFGISREYANDMRDSWIHVIDIILHWFKQGLLDEALIVDDFALNRQVAIKRHQMLKATKDKPDAQSSSVFTSLFSSLFASSEVTSGEDATDGKVAHHSTSQDPSNASGSGHSDRPANEFRDFIDNHVQPLSVMEESKFLHSESLVQLIRSIINLNLELIDETGDDIESFKLEMLIQITLLNRDRVTLFWNLVSNHLVRLLKSTAAEPSELLSERTISAIFRLAIRFTPRPDQTSDEILNLLRTILITFEPSVIQKECTAVALSSFITQCYPFIKRVDDWSLIFDYLLCVGIGCHPSDLPERPVHTFDDEEEEEPAPSVDQEMNDSSIPSSAPINVPAPSSAAPQDASSPPYLSSPSVAIEMPDIDPMTIPGLTHQIMSDLTSQADSSSSSTPDEPVLPDVSQPEVTDPPASITPPESSTLPLPVQPLSPPEVMPKVHPVAPAPVQVQSPPRSSSPVDPQPFIPGNTTVRDVDAYKKCMDILTVVIKEILPKNSTIQTNVRADKEINQMAIDSLITLRFYSLHDESLREPSSSSSGRKDP